MKKTIAVILTVDLEEEVSQDVLNCYICNEFGWLTESGITLKDFSNVPNDTTIKEIRDAIVHNRSKQIEKEYQDDLQELA